MNNLCRLTIALLAGLALGAIFFGGLWWTVRQGVRSNSPARWFFGSWLLRTGAVLAGFYFVGRGDWERLVTCLGGFIIARGVVLRMTRAPVEAPDPMRKEAGHAP